MQSQFTGTLSQMQALELFIESQESSNLVYSTQQNRFYLFESGVWKYAQIHQVIMMLRIFLAENGCQLKSFNSYTGLANFLKSTDKIVYDGNFDTDTMLLNFKNGTIDARTQHFTAGHAAAKAAYSTIQYEFNFDPTADCPTYKKAVYEALPQEKADYVLDLEAYALFPSYEIEKIWMFYGNGRNGKGVILEGLRAVLPKIQYASVSLKDITTRPFALNLLKRATVNVSSEPEQDFVAEQEMLKKLSGGNDITADVKNKDFIQFVNKAKLIIELNGLPTVNELNNAIKNRYVVIRFDKTFTGKNADNSLKDKIYSEHAGILNLLLSRIPRIYNGHNFYFEEPESVKQDTLNAICEFNPVSSFLADEATISANSKVLAKRLYEAYRDSTAKRMTMRSFTKTLKELGYNVAKSTSNKTYVFGLSL